MALAAALARDAAAQKQAAPDADLGALLYDTYCVACHSAQIHWRDGRRVADWASLEAEVRRWARNIGLAWTDAEIAAVARRLNALHYHFPVPDRVAGAPRGAR